MRERARAQIASGPSPLRLLSTFCHFLHQCSLVVVAVLVDVSPFSSAVLLRPTSFGCAAAVAYFLLLLGCCTAAAVTSNDSLTHHLTISVDTRAPEETDRWSPLLLLSERARGSTTYFENFWLHNFFSLEHFFFFLITRKSAAAGQCCSVGVILYGRLLACEPKLWLLNVH